MPPYYSPYSGRAAPRRKFLASTFKKIKELVLSILEWFKTNPWKTFCIVIAPLLVSGYLQKLLRKAGFRVPRWLQGKEPPTKVSKKQKKRLKQKQKQRELLEPPSHNEAFKLAASVGGMRGLMAMASMLA